MKKYSLLLCFLAAGVYAIAQPWTKKYDRIDACNCGLALVEKAGKFGFVNEEGKLIIPLIYDDAVAFSEDKAAVSVGGKWGFVDKKGNELVKPQYTEVYSFNEGMAVVGMGDEYGFIDSTGKVVIPMNYTNARSFADSIAPVCNKKGLWGTLIRMENK